jgi:hypothetical protein
VLLPTSKASPKKRTDAAYTETFLRFWAAYPRKVAKKDAWTAWRAKEQSGGLPLDTILAALSWQTQTTQWTEDGGGHIPYPATYLNGARWEDEPTTTPTHSRQPDPTRGHYAASSTPPARTGRVDL